MSRQQVLRRDLAGWVESRQMAREPAHDAKPLTPIRRVRLPRQPGPVQRQIGGDPLRAGPLEKGHETFQQPAVLRHLEPEPATHLQIAGQRITKVGHGAPTGAGHGGARGRSAARSTFA